jgi:hypothetical protein
MDFLTDNWGSLASVVGVVVSVVGLSLVVLQASRARSAAEAAEVATVETRGAIGSILAVVDLERAIALVQRIKALHQIDKLEAALEHYQTLRYMLADIQTRHLGLTDQERDKLGEAVPQITAIENRVRETLGTGLPPVEVSRVGLTLNVLQESLERIASGARIIATTGGT